MRCDVFGTVDSSRTITIGAVKRADTRRRASRKLWRQTNRKTILPFRLCFYFSFNYRIIHSGNARARVVTSRMWNSEIFSVLTGLIEMYKKIPRDMIKFPAVSLPITSAYWITIYYVLIGCSIQSHEWRLAGSEEEDRNNATQRYNLMAHPVFNTQKRFTSHSRRILKIKSAHFFFLARSISLARSIHVEYWPESDGWLRHIAHRKYGRERKTDDPLGFGWGKKMFYDTKRKRWITRERETSNRRRANRRQCNNW